MALGRSNWLFAGSLRAGKRAAVVMSLMHSARINWHDQYAYLKDTRTAADLSGQPHRRLTAAPLDGADDCYLSFAACVKMRLPDAYGPSTAELMAGN